MAIGLSTGVRIEILFAGQPAPSRRATAADDLLLCHGRPPELLFSQCSPKACPGRLRGFFDEICFNSLNFSDCFRSRIWSGRPALQCGCIRARLPVMEQKPLAPPGAARLRSR